MFCILRFRKFPRKLASVLGPLPIPSADRSLAPLDRTPALWVPLVKTMFGEQQMSALSDMIQAALMLRTNKRRLG